MTEQEKKTIEESIRLLEDIWIILLINMKGGPDIEKVANLVSDTKWKLIRIGEAEDV